jgi:hypothetical protein
MASFPPMPGISDDGGTVLLAMYEQDEPVLQIKGDYYLGGEYLYAVTVHELLAAGWIAYTQHRQGFWLTAMGERWVETNRS